MVLLDAPFDELPARLLLGTSTTVLLLSIASLFVDALPGPPPRGEVKTSDRAVRLCATFLRVCVAASLVASLTPGAIETFKYLRGGALGMLGSGPTNVWMNTLMQHAVNEHISVNGPLGVNMVVGVGKYGLQPTSRSIKPLSWSCLLLIVVTLSICGAVLGVFAEVQLIIRGVFVFMYAHGILWIIIALLSTFIQADLLPLDETPLRAKWFDRLYATNPQRLDETRLLSNWAVIVDNPNVQGRRHRNLKWLSEVPSFKRSFCSQFNAHIPSVVSTPHHTNGANQSEVTTQTPVPLASISTEPLSVIESEPSPTFAPSISTAPQVKTSSRQNDLQNDVQLNPRPGPNQERFDTLTPPSVSAQQPSPFQQPFPIAIPADLEIESTPVGILTQPLDEETVVEDEPSRRPLDGQPALPPLDQLDMQQLGEVLVVYVAGRGLGAGPLRALAYLASGVLVSAPAAAAQALARPVHAPLTVAWALGGTLLAFRGTPQLLRPAVMPRGSESQLSICGRLYSVRIADDRVIRAARLDFASVALLFVALLVRGYAWFRASDIVLTMHETNDVKLVDYE